MRTVVWLLLIGTVLGCLTAIGLSIAPGALFEHLLVVLVTFLIFATSTFAVCALVSSVLAYVGNRRKWRTAHSARTNAVIALLLAAASFVLAIALILWPPGDSFLEPEFGVGALLALLAVVVFVPAIPRQNQEQPDAPHQAGSSTATDISLGVLVIASVALLLLLLAALVTSYGEDLLLGILVTLPISILIRPRTRRILLAWMPVLWRATPKKKAMAIPVAACATCAFLALDVPLKAAFFLSRTSFERALASAPVCNYAAEPETHSDLERFTEVSSPESSPECRCTQPSSRLGVYKIDRYAADEHGGVFFSLYDEEAAGSSGHSATFHGFAYQPNRESTPFGARDYSALHLMGDWYEFEVTGPWHGDDERPWD